MAGGKMMLKKEHLMNQIKALTFDDYLPGLLLLSVCLFISSAEHIVLWMNYLVQ